MLHFLTHKMTTKRKTEDEESHQASRQDLAYATLANVNGLAAYNVAPDLGIHNSLPSKYLTDDEYGLTTLSGLLCAMGKGLMKRALRPGGSVRQNPGIGYDKLGGAATVLTAALQHPSLPINHMGGITDIWVETRVTYSTGGPTRVFQNPNDVDLCLWSPFLPANRLGPRVIINVQINKLVIRFEIMHMRVYANYDEGRGPRVMADAGINRDHLTRYDVYILQNITFMRPEPNWKKPLGIPRYMEDDTGLFLFHDHPIYFEIPKQGQSKKIRWWRPKDGMKFYAIMREEHGQMMTMLANDYNLSLEATNKCPTQEPRGKYMGMSIPEGTFDMNGSAGTPPNSYVITAGLAVIGAFFDTIGRLDNEGEPSPPNLLISALKNILFDLHSVNYDTGTSKRSRIPYYTVMDVAL